MLSTISNKDFENFKNEGFNRIPLVLECFADLDTPLSVYSKLANDRYSYLLESADGGNKYGRYSIIGLPAKIRIQIKKNIISVFNKEKLIDKVTNQNPLNFIDDFMSQFKIPKNLDLPRFSGGLAGYFGYETIQYIEPRLSKEFLNDKLDLPDILLMLSDEVVVFDNVSAYSGPFHGDNTILFTLNEGTKAQLYQEQGEWFEIVILNGGKAWIPKEKIRIL